MPNMESIDKIIDNYVLKAANDISFAWNYVTGKTKSQLANLTLTIGTMVASTVSVLEGIVDQQGSALMAVPLYLFCAHGLQSLNTRIDNLEAEALEANAKSLEAEKEKQNYCKHGYLFAAVGALFATIPDNTDGVIYPAQFCALYMMSLSASSQIMRADYLPPCKNVLERMYDYVAGLFRKPVPATVKN